MAAEGVNARLIQQQAYGFWVRTKQTRRAVRWSAQLNDKGNVTYRGRNWVEVLEHGAERPPERFYGADVELAGPHEWLDYYPSADEPVCGWQEVPGSQQYCPRRREQDEPFCRKHMSELQGEDNHAREGEGEAGSQPG
jgi:hypothetical protein